MRFSTLIEPRCLSSNAALLSMTTVQPSCRMQRDVSTGLLTLAWYARRWKCTSVKMQYHLTVRDRRPLERPNSDPEQPVQTVMKTRKQLREILDDIDVTIPEAKKRHADDEAELLMEVRSMVQFAVLSAGVDDRDWMISQMHILLMAHGISATAWSIQ